jgi:hypothetical protein
MQQAPPQQMPTDQPPAKGTGDYLSELSSATEKYLVEHPDAAEILEAQIEPKAEKIASYIADKPYLQQKLADLVDYSPSRWLLMQEIPQVRARRAIHPNLRDAPYDPKAAHPKARDPYEWARNGVLQGICFSGGGIRSATLNLGVLQGLAEHRILNHFDYLSSVSGGGYIHEWFAAWIKREEQERKERAKQTGSPEKYVQGSGFEEVKKRLVPLPSTQDYPTHPEPIRWLRRYSNYLTPQKGLFTGDTWVAVAIWLRNTFPQSTYFDFRPFLPVAAPLSDRNVDPRLAPSLLDCRVSATFSGSGAHHRL